MSRKDFIHQLTKALKGLPEHEIKEIASDYEEHFSIGLSEGRTEAEIAQALGDPTALARELKASSQITRAQHDSSNKNVFNALGATIALGFFNLIFVLGPFIAALSIVLSFAITSFTLVITGIAVIASGFLQDLFPEYLLVFNDYWIHVFVGLGLISLGIAFGYVVKSLGKLFKTLTLKYLAFNVKLIKRK